MNYKTISHLIVIVIILIALEILVIPVHGAEIRRPMQGDLVAVGEIIDITGTFGWAEKIAYYGYSGDLESEPLYTLELPNTKKGYYQFYLDPTIFGTRLGPWYQFYGNGSTIEHGNLLMFRVVKELPTVNVTPTGPTVVPTPTQTPMIVEPKKFETDFQIAYGDPLTLPVNTKQPPPRLWVFGRIDSVYNKTFAKQTAFLAPSEIQKLEPGTYTIITQFPGKNTIFEVGYSKVVDVQNSKTVEQLTSPWVAVKPIDIYGVQPRTVLSKFQGMIKGTDDIITEYRMEVAHPAVDIRQVDETYWQGKDVLDIRGYTNVAKDTRLDVVMDLDKQTEKTLPGSTFNATVQEEKPNQWRYFQVYIPINYEEIPVGQHEITVTAPQGASQTVPFYVYDLPKGQETPNETIKYVAGDIFTPPEIITVVQTIKIIETQTIFVPVTPNDEQVYIAQKKASDANWRYWLTTLGILGLVGVVVSLSSWYLWGVVKRARRMK